MHKAKRVREFWSDDALKEVEDSAETATVVPTAPAIPSTSLRARPRKKRRKSEVLATPPPVPGFTPDDEAELDALLAEDM